MKTLSTWGGSAWGGMGVEAATIGGTIGGRGVGCPVYAAGADVGRSPGGGGRRQGMRLRGVGDGVMKSRGGVGEKSRCASAMNHSSNRSYRPPEQGGECPLDGCS